MAVLAVLTILLNLWLIPLFGIEGAAVASFLAMLTFNLTKYIFVWYKFGIQPFNSKTLVLLAIAAGALILNSLVVPFNNPLLDLLLRSTMIAFFVLGLAYWLKVSDEFNNLIHQVLEKLNLR